MLSSGFVFGRLIVDPKTQLLLMQVGGKADEQPRPTFDVVCSDLKSIRSLLSAKDEDLKIHFRLITPSSVEILQAERRPEEKSFGAGLFLYVSKMASLHQGVVEDVGLVTKEFLDKKVWDYMDTPECERDDWDNEPNPWQYTIQLLVPPSWAMVFEHAPERLRGQVIQPSGSMSLGRDLLELKEGCELGALPIRTFIDQFHSGYERPQLPGAQNAQRRVPPALRKKVLLRDGHRCVDCGANPATDPFVTLEVDHRVSIANGGTNSMDNLQTLCWACNRGKGAQNDHKLDIDPWATA